MEVFGIIGKKDFCTVLTEVLKVLHCEENYRIGIKFMLVCGEKDGTGNIEKTARQWAEMEPNCEFHMIENAGHCANPDNPEVFNRLLLDFLARQTNCNANR